MKPMKSYLVAHRLVTGCLLLLGFVLFAAAIWQPETSEPPGWIAMNEQVKQALEPLAQQEQQNAFNSTGNKAPETKSGSGSRVIGGEAARSEPSGAAEERSGITGANGSSKEAGTVKAGGASAEDGKIDINRANAQEFDALPGIGAIKAQTIVADREKNGRFQTADDLLRVKGIGPKLLDKIRGSIVARP
ncbi:ComEA family DNA-binding protein [Paenibacillus sp. sptzw28]|uniref:ComEA family DNA-binding protein n=1 Tax=Paenibacillus sp. sptzw28 TaxID=715179 RepID=UPI001C6EE48A|nr:ComEA family DNA-binding protein [Paenibacillus sp. sptzw28]QYR20175.1 ComEA family DNA-binding protein [Paenibacillus sp. sptzw28]